MVDVYKCTGSCATHTHTVYVYTNPLSSKILFIRKTPSFIVYMARQNVGDTRVVGPRGGKKPFDKSG